MQRLARDKSGNTFAMLAASVVPLLALVGGGVDMGRAYLSESRLQQACDAGVLAARKALGSDKLIGATLTDKAKDAGTRFFNINYRDGAYGTTDRNFTMTLDAGFSVSGEATVTVPTTIMSLFGNKQMPISVECGAQLNFQNTDVMMVLDVTGSMRHFNPGDTLSRLDSLKKVIREFHTQLEGAKASGTRIRYGFVPYSSNVNVGHLLEDDWVVDEWEYQGREPSAAPGSTDVTYWTNWVEISGTRSPWTVVSPYPATPAAAGTGDLWECTGTQPANTWTATEVPLSTTTNAVPGGTQTIEHIEKTHNGTRYETHLVGSTCEVRASTDTNYVQEYDLITEPAAKWNYLPVLQDTTNWRAETQGCMEERATYEIDDFNSIDFSKALDLDINTVPTPGNTDTQWRPMYPDLIYVRKFIDEFTGTFEPKKVMNTEDEYIATGWWWLSACPAPAQKLKEMNATDVDAYLATLEPYGATYHDVGLIWGGRLLSKDGLFAAENADVPGSLATSRHIIFLTDGQTEPYDIAYSSYGVDPIDERRWSKGSTLSLSEVVEQRYLAACKQIKKNNTKVWVIAFGTTLNPVMKECAGAGQYFEAKDAKMLSDTFEEIANSMADLRLAK
ncbi:MAG: TadE/TadG family protein [Altererythrobacter sp.]